MDKDLVSEMHFCTSGLYVYFASMFLLFQPKTSGGRCPSTVPEAESDPGGAMPALAVAGDPCTAALLEAVQQGESLSFTFAFAEA